MNKLSDMVEVGVDHRPRKIVCYGEHGVGKTWWAARFPKPLIVCIEDGASEVDCAKVPTHVLVNCDKVMEVVYQCKDSPYETIVVDSIDWFDRQNEEALHNEGFDTDFGKGVVELGRRMKKFLDLLDMSIQSGKTVVVLAHQEVRTATDIQGRTWDQIRPKLSKRATEVLLEWADEVFLAKREDFVRSEKGAFGVEKGVASTSGRRVLRTDSHPSYIAKRRRVLPDEISMDAEIDQFLSEKE